MAHDSDTDSNIMMSNVNLGNQNDVKAFLSLDPEIVTLLTCIFTTTDVRSSLPVLCESISRLHKLTHFDLEIENDTGDLHRYGIPDRDAAPLHHLFHHFHHMSSFSLVAFTGLDMDASVRTLIRNNPGLQKLSLIGMRIKSGSVEAMSRLTCLTIIGLVEIGFDVKPEDLLTLLRGGSRDKIRRLELDRENMNHEVDCEIDLVAGESGMIAKRKSGINNTVIIRFREGQW